MVFFSLIHHTCFDCETTNFFDPRKTFRFLSNPKTKNVRRKKNYEFFLLKKVFRHNSEKIIFFKYFKLSVFSKVFLRWTGEEAGLKNRMKGPTFSIKIFVQENKNKTQDIQTNRIGRRFCLGFRKY